jgi:hypothetical protein
LIEPLTYLPLRFAVRRELLPPALHAPFARGVGQSANGPHPVSDMLGANVGSLYAMPFHIVPDRGQVSENVAKSSTKES